MKNLYSKAFAPIVLVLLAATMAFAQTTISGKLIDGASGEALAGVNIVVKGKVIGTISDTRGEFNLKVNDAPPLILIFSFVGYKTQEVEIKEASTSSLSVTMEEQALLGQEVVISASRYEESILKAPVTVEKLDLLSIRQSATPDFYDALANVKGVQTSSGSMNFTAFNTRGFATIANVRFVQWVDGMDTQAPLLNFPTGSIMGLSELDAESVELVPGAASALYGPNAFNGIMLMNSKSPFEFQGLSAQVKLGMTNSDAGGSHPLSQYSIRYAKAFNNKFAFKVNFSYMKATDWTGNDYKTDRNKPESEINLSSSPDFDGLNLYGDETRITPGLPNVGTITRTGFREEDMLATFSDDRDAKTIKGDAALHYRITDKIEILYNYRYGGGSSIYQGTEKYALRDFSQQFHKLELKGDNFFVRGYITQTDAGKSYNLSALGGFANESYSASRSTWVPDYVKALQGYKEDPNYEGDVIAGDHTSARNYADRYRPQAGTQEFKDLMKAVRDNYFQKVPVGAAGGASFSDDSRLKHAEFNYKFANQITWAEVQVGGNLRQYDLFSNGTIFNEAPNDGVNFERIKINEFGVYTQISKTLADALKLTGSLRYDKNENFDGHLTPRISAVYTVANDHNVRASFQTGFRNPDTQAQYIFFPSSSGTLIGSAQDNAERYGVHNGGAWTLNSYNQFIASGGTINPKTGEVTSGDGDILQIANVGYVKPEQLQSYELGYKGLIAKKLLIDLNGYYTNYKNFIGSQIFVSDHPIVHQDSTWDAGALFSPYNNSTKNVTSWGIGLGVSYSLPSNFVVTANYNYADYKATESDEFRAGFNTPKSKFNIGIGNRKIIENLGFNINYRYQQEFDWVSSYGMWTVPAFGVLDAQLNYKLSAIKTMVKVGGTNIGGGDYRTNFGSPFIGQQYYISLTFDQFLK